MRRTASSPNFFLFFATSLAVNSFVLWLIYKWIRTREEGALASTEAIEESMSATQKVNASVKNLMDYYEVLQGQIQELKDDLAILRKEKRDFSEEMRSLEQKANEQGERLSSLRSSFEAELKSTKESVSTQLGRVIMFGDEIQEHKKRIADLEAKVARHTEDFQSLHAPPENGAASENEISLL